MQALTLFTLRVIVLPAQQREVINSLVALLEPTRVQPGCLNCCLYSDHGNPNAFLLISEWSSLPELESYLNLDARKTMLAAMDLSCEEPQVRIDTVIRKVGPALLAGSNQADSLQ